MANQEATSHALNEVEFWEPEAERITAAQINLPEWWGAPFWMGLTLDQIKNVAEEPKSAVSPSELRLAKILSGQGRPCTPDEKEAESYAIRHIEACADIDSTDDWGYEDYSAHDDEEDERNWWWLERYEREENLILEELHGPSSTDGQVYYGDDDPYFDPWE